MFIRESKIEDLIYIKEIYKSAREFMKNNGNGTQWGDFGQLMKLFYQIFIIKKSYVCIENDEISVVFFCEFGKEYDSYIKK